MVLIGTQSRIWLAAQIRVVGVVATLTPQVRYGGEYDAMFGFCNIKVAMQRHLTFE